MSLMTPKSSSLEDLVGKQVDIGDSKISHCEWLSYDVLPYTSTRPLGQGGYAAVDEVRTRDGLVLARKVLRRRYHEDPELAKIRLLNEVRIMASLQPARHIVSIFGSYECEGDFALLMNPVANGGSLDKMLADIRNAGVVPSHYSEILRKSFGCLAQTLAYIHRKLIRHKDISPANILIHQGELLLSDFGIALDCSDSQTTTTGAHGPANRRYSAPEVLEVNGSRTRKTDVFSLGCVFCEVVSCMETNLDVSPKNFKCYSESIESITSTLNDYVCTVVGKSPRLPIIIYQTIPLMLHRQMAARPISEEVAQAFAMEPSMFCEACLGTKDLSREIPLEKSTQQNSIQKQPAKEQFVQMINDAT